MKLNRIHGFTPALVAGILLLPPALYAQVPAAAQNDAQAATDRQLMTEVKSYNELMKNLEYLADQIGPRLTGSPNLDRASQWTEQRFKDYGLENVHRQAVDYPAFLGTRTGKRPHGESGGPSADAGVGGVGCGDKWPCPRTGGVRESPETEQDLEQYKGKLKGAWLIMAEPHDLEPPVDPMLVPYGDPDVPLNKAVPPTTQTDGPQFYRFMMAIYKFAGQEGAAGVLISSDKKYGLLNMFSLGGPAYFENPIPTVILSWEDYNWIWRLLPQGAGRAGVEYSEFLRGKASDGL